MSLIQFSKQTCRLFLLFIIPGTLSDGHGSMGTCDMDATTCEFFLDVQLWLPMRKGVNQKVYINETNGKLYLHGGDPNVTIDPDDVVLADGSKHERVLYLFNKTMPGPTLTVYVNQEVIVHVKNNLISDGISVHFHGIEMRGTPWMDGAAFITQCPILPGQTFTYRFRPNRSGTYFYHSHTGTQINMGLSGAFIVKEKQTDNTEEHIIFVQDYSNEQTSDEVFTRMYLGDINPDGVPLRPSGKIDGTLETLVDFKSSLINGRGRVFDSQGGELTKTPLSVFMVEHGKQYRFRVIGGGFGIQHKVSVDGHKLKLIAADGLDVEPVIADFFILHSGERFDFIIQANETASNYWIRADTLQPIKNLAGYAILRYEGSEEVDPISSINMCNESIPCTVVNCPFETYPNWNCVHIDEMHSSNNDPAPLATSANFKEFFVNMAGALGEDGVVYLHMNGISLKLPTVSALTQPKELTGLCGKCMPNKVCFCNRPLNVDFGDVVQINFLSRGFLNVINHPIHIHGYSVHVLKVGYRQTNASFANLGDNADINCPGQCYSNASWANETWKGGNIPGVDLTRAPRKDTITVPAGGYAVVRFVADNPGLWYIHCHQEFHSKFGMGLLLNDSFSRIPPPPAGFPECRSFPPPDWVANPPQPTNNDDDSEVDKAEERTFSEEEFWGMFGALMFVILLQFILFIICMNRHNKASVSF
ncbi:uncharacterized protein LOC128559972 [Mercenaria mercenaria]|uniref:uncharacterized protein LOC128559972 n=1 Tax=Mercenaria mercenaria TaxID=6596 RepID=UPI00234E3DFE|nr:uncharacterized protein LOC128559972 [Mercenaria mercenaria]XP_053409259.1 uncharacterized protein LOC128559972 [Mercenaria mercenaria]